MNNAKQLSPLPGIAPFGLSPLQLIALLVVFTAAVYARFKNLGVAAIALDEFHSILAVELILESGLPEFETGGMYSRGLVLNYLVAGMSLATGAEPLLLFRLLTAASSVLALFGTFLLGRALFGNAAGVGAVAALGLSLIDIDTARYARMYAPFHCIAVFYFLNCVKLLGDDGRPGHFRWLIALSTIGALVAEASALLAILSFFALLVSPIALRTTRVAAALAAIAVTGALPTFKWWDAVAVGAYPAGYVPASEEQIAAKLGPFILPESGIYGVLALLGIGAVAFALLRIRSTTDSAPVARAVVTDAVFSLAIAGSIFGQFATAAGTLLAGVCLDSRPWLRYRRSTVVICVAILATASTCWVAYTLITSGLDGGAVGTAKTFVNERFGYPPLIDAILLPWLQTLPLATVMLAIGLAGFFIVNRFAGIKSTPRSDVPATFLALLIVLAMVIAIISTPYRQIRYSQFLYPALLCMAIGGYLGLLGRFDFRQRFVGLASGLVVLAVLIVSDDTRLGYFPTIGSYDETYRVSPGLEMMRSRSDFIGPASYLDSVPGKTTVLSTIRQIDYHTDAIDAIVMLQSDARFKFSSAAGGTRELWTNLPLIHSLNDLLTVVCNADGDVLLVYPGSAYAFRNELESYLTELPGSVVFESRDKRVAIKAFSSRESGSPCAAAQPGDGPKASSLSADITGAAKQRL